MKKITVLFFLLWTGIIHSQTYNLNVWSNGKVISIPVEDIQKLTFSNLSNGTGKEQITTVVKSFKLLQNYPNPFNPSTTIEYQIPENGMVEIKIFGITGQLIRTYENHHMSSGPHAITWDGKNEQGQSVAGGLYIYQVSYENALIAKKMMLVK